MSDDIESIRREIVATRDRLSASVETLAYRANVPARAKEAVDEKIGSAKDALFGALGRGRRTVAKAADHAGADGKYALAHAQSMAASASRSVASMRETLGEPLQRFNDVLPAPSVSRGSTERMQAFLTRNPLGFALASVAVGLLIGFVLPISDIERETLGPVGLHVIDDATSAAGDVIEHGKAVVATIVSESESVTA
jgi:hypothetical protein